MATSPALGGAWNRRSSLRLSVLADGPLHLLGFAALADPLAGDRPRYLIERLPVYQAPSATVAVELASRPIAERAGHTVVALGDPAYDRPTELTAGRIGNAPLARLPETRREIEALGEVFATEARLYLGKAAREEVVKGLGRDVAILHMAGHAVLDERFPLDSYLAFSPPGHGEEEVEDGRLRAWEVFEQLRLDADLVTLSACETALGPEMAGEGLVGLTRAFQFAGARTVLATLWKVSDRSTSRLMADFYGALRDGLPKAAALRRAQLTLLSQKATAHPFHWAGFQLYGDPR